MSNDITFCSNKECEKKNCRRHMDNLPGKGFYSMCTFNKGKDVGECDWYWEVKEEVKEEK